MVRPCLTLECWKDAEAEAGILRLLLSRKGTAVSARPASGRQAVPCPGSSPRHPCGSLERCLFILVACK